MKNSKIPKISNRKLYELAKRIKPLVRFQMDDFEDKSPSVDKDGKPIRARSNSQWKVLFEIEQVDLRKTVYTWNPKPIGEPRNNIACFDIIRTYHSCGHPSLFKPSVAEVIAQIPKDIVDRVVAFEIINAEDMDVRYCVGGGYYHAVLTRLYMDRRQWEEESSY